MILSLCVVVLVKGRMGVGFLEILQYSTVQYSTDIEILLGPGSGVMFR